MNYINGVSIITEKPKAYEKIEFQLFETKDYRDLNINPFDYSEFKIQGRIKSPSNKEYVVPAFWYQDYEIILNENWTQKPAGIHGTASTNENEPQGLEVVESIGSPHFRLRFLPEEHGKFDLTIEVVEKGKIVQSFKNDFFVLEGDKDYKGVIQVEQKNKRNFIFENGETFIPVGQNNGWFTSSNRKTEDYKVWFSKMNENGANFSRIWMATWSFSLHWGDSYYDFTSRQSAAARLDRVLEIAEENDIYFMLTLLNHGQFSNSVNPEWGNNPWNIDNGGILSLPSQFFTSVEAKEIYKQQILYIIARFGHAPTLMSWELFNEVDWTDQFNSLSVHLWHREMAEFIKENDPYNRLVTTSYKAQSGSAYQLNDIDFSNPHDYGYDNKHILTNLYKTLDRIYRDFKKPVLHSEIGINWQSGNDTANVDPTGVSLKQSQWAGIMGGGAGAAMNWWWDSWVHPKDLYYRFIGISKFSKEMNMVSDNYELLHNKKGIVIDKSNIGLLGYVLDDRIYGYAFDTKWNYKTAVTTEKEVSITIPFENGSYILEIYDTNTGEVIKTLSLDISNGKAIVDLTFIEDSAFIIKRN